MPTTSLMPLPKQQFLSALGTPLIGGKVYTYAAGTTNPKQTFTDAAGTTPQANPIPLNLRGEPDSPIFWSGNYRVDVRDALGNLVYSVDNYNTDPAGLWSILTTLAANAGATLMGFIQAGAGAIKRTVQDKLRDSVNVKDFGAVGDGATDDTAAIQAAMTASVCVEIPAGTFKHTRLVQKFHGQVLRGQGQGATTLYCPAGYAITNFSGLDSDPVGADWRGGLVIDGLTLQGGFVHTDKFAAPDNSWATGSGRGKPFTTVNINAGLRLKEAFPYRVRDATIKNFHRGTYATGAALGRWSNFEVSDCQYGFYGENGATWGDASWQITTHHWRDGRFHNCWIGIGGSDFVQCQVYKRTVDFEPCNSGIAVTNGGENTWGGYFELCSEGIYRNGGFMGSDVIEDPFFGGSPGSFWGAGDSILLDNGIGAGGRVTLRNGGATVTGGGIRVLGGRLSQPERYQGALVFITAGAPAGGYAPFKVACALAATTDDTSGFFSAAANTRLTIPGNLRGARVKLHAQVTLAGDATANDVAVQITKNGAAINGGALWAQIFSYGATANLETAVLTVAAGDYFEIQVSMNLPRGVTGGTPQAWFAIEVVE